MAINIVTPQSYATFTVRAIAQKHEYDTPTGTIPVMPELGMNTLPKGGHVKSITCIPRAGVAKPTSCQLYRSWNNGEDVVLIDMVIMPAYTKPAASADSTQPPIVSFKYSSTNPLRLAPGETLHVAIGQTNEYGINFDFQIESFTE